MFTMNKHQQAAAQSIHRLIEKSKNSHPAFTMIELIVVIGILGILMAILIGTFSGSTESARSAKCLANMRNLAMAVQSVGMGTGDYPYAGSFKQYKSTGRTVVNTPGWISWTKNGNYQPTSKEEIEYCITNGTIWASMKGARDCYVCPVYSEKGGTLSWSYAMNAYFGWEGNGKTRYHSHHGKGYRSFRRPDRHLLFAEIASSSGTGSDAESSAKKADPVLQYSGCEGGGDEEIAFNHKDGKYSVAHVCFADGHVEKLRAPKTGNAKDLTKWLCRPVDDKGQDFDISFDGKQYQKVQ